MDKLFSVCYELVISWHFFFDNSWLHILHQTLMFSLTFRESPSAHILRRIPWPHPCPATNRPPHPWPFCMDCLWLRFKHRSTCGPAIALRSWWLLIPPTHAQRPADCRVWPSGLFTTNPLLPSLDMRFKGFLLPSGIHAGGLPRQLNGVDETQPNKWATEISMSLKGYQFAHIQTRTLE